MRWVRHVAHVGEGRKVYRVWVGKPKGRRLLGRPRHGWEVGRVWSGFVLLRIGIDGRLW
jgi:hypothetical protein